MHFLDRFYNKTLKRDLINKFIYKNTKDLPTIKKVILNFGCGTTNIKQLASRLLALELISNKKGSFTKTNCPNILFKIRKGNPTGCKVTLSKSQQSIFLGKLVLEIFPKLKNFKGFSMTKKLGKKVFSCELVENFSFSELDSHYYLFNSLPKLDITIVTNAKTEEEFLFLLKSFQLPFKN